MKRRVFIVASVVSGTALALLPQEGKSNIKLELFKTLEAVQQVLFPEGLNAPSAKAFGATAYLANVSTHSSFLDSDLLFLQQGAQELMNDYNNFLTLNPKKQEKALREFVDNNHRGESWVSFVLYFTLEALLADPLYWGNRKESGWKWLNHHSGFPRPKVPFAENLKGEVI